LIVGIAFASALA